jgi:transcriptional regulator with PAS, ATPase and Fis domain
LAIEQEIECAARTDAKVLITGESGVGKEVVANLIHQRSRRRYAPFVAINCAGVPDTLLESEMFGHVRGSFTDAYRDKRGWVETASGGSIFLDEVGEMSVRMQAVLLRFLDNGELQRVGCDQPHAIADVRVIAATNRSLVDSVAKKEFRDDLYYRLNVIHIPVPPLRERAEDIPALIAHFVRLSSNNLRVPPPRLLDEAAARLVAYSWPGNVRELKNVIERLVVRAGGGPIPVGDLPREIAGHWPVAPRPASDAATEKGVSELLYERMTLDGESFWTAVYDPFMARDITRDDLRAVIGRGLSETKGSYKLLLEVFNLGPADYKRLLGFLRKYQCHLPFHKFRTAAVPSSQINFSRDRRLAQIS